MRSIQAGTKLFWKSAEQSTMDEVVLSLLFNSLKRVFVSGLRAETSPEHNVGKLFDRGTSFL